MKILRLFLATILLFSFGLFATPSYAADGYGATALTGGTAGCLDAIDGATLSDGDKALVTTATQFYVYNLDDDSAAVESSPTIISPDSNAGDKRWILVSQASATISGMVELATDAETITGTDTTRAITPANLAARTATATRTGVVELATDAETQTGTDTARAITPANLTARLGEIVGAVMAFAMSTPPTGWLECSGAAVSRVTYAALFALIGDDYGVGDGATTFNLPDLRGRFLRGWDHGAGTDPDAATRTDRGDGTGGDVVGSKQADGFKAHTHTRGWHTDAGGSTAGAAVGAAAITGSTGGNETRPVNINVMYCIKF